MTDKFDFNEALKAIQSGQAMSGAYSGPFRSLILVLSDHFLWISRIDDQINPESFLTR